MMDEEEGVLERYANMLNSKLMHISFVYLGIPIATNPRKVETWKLINDKFAKMLLAWVENTRFCLLRVG